MRGEPPNRRPLLYAALQYVGKQTAFPGKTQTPGRDRLHEIPGNMRVSDIGNPGR